MTNRPFVMSYKQFMWFVVCYGLCCVAITAAWTSIIWAMLT